MTGVPIGSPLALEGTEVKDDAERFLSLEGATEKSGCGYDITHALGLDPAMVHLELDYAAPVSFPGHVTVKTRVTLCEGKKLGFSYEVWSDGADRPCAKANSFHIWVKDGKNCDLERAYPDVFAGYRSMME